MLLFFLQLSFNFDSIMVHIFHIRWWISINKMRNFLIQTSKKPRNGVFLIFSDFFSSNQSLHLSIIFSNTFCTLPQSLQFSFQISFIMFWNKPFPHGFFKFFPSFYWILLFPPSFGLEIMIQFRCIIGELGNGKFHLLILTKCVAIKHMFYLPFPLQICLRIRRSSKWWNFEFNSPISIFIHSFHHSRLHYVGKVISSSPSHISSTSNQSFMCV